MFWLSLDGVKKELLDCKFSDKVAIKYYFAFVVWEASMIGIFGFSNVNLKSDLFFIVFQILVIVAPVLGTFIVLLRGDIFEKLERPLVAFFPVGWIIHLRLMLFLSPLYGLSWYLCLPNVHYPAVSFLLSLITSLIYYYAFYYYTRNELHQLIHKES